MIFITGGTGFVGSHLTYRLVSQGVAVRLLVRNRSKISQLAKVFNYYNDDIARYNSLIEYADGDVTDVYSIQDGLKHDTDYIFHCAGLVSFWKHDKLRLNEVNHSGTANVVNAAIEAGVKKLVYVSSIAALGDSVEKTISEKNHQYDVKPTNYYGKSKHNGELEVWRASEEGLRVIIVNPTVIVGPGQWRDGSPKLFRSVWKGLPFYTNGSTGFTDVRYVVNCMVDLAFGSIENQQFIINNENLNYRQFFNLVADNLRVRRPRFEAQPWLMYFFASILGFFGKLAKINTGINRQLAQSALSVSNYDSSKLEQTIGKSAEPIENAVAFTATSFLKDHR